MFSLCLSKMEEMSSTLGIRGILLVVDMPDIAASPGSVFTSGSLLLSVAELFSLSLMEMQLPDACSAVVVDGAADAAAAAALT